MDKQSKFIIKTVFKKIIIIFFYFLKNTKNITHTNTTQDKFFELLSKNKINKFIVINKNKVSFTLNDKKSNLDSNNCKSHLSHYEF